ncbi:MAG: hypothetical protein ACRC3A_08930, partial [Culicoidibacterales bacterium]
MSKEKLTPPVEKNEYYDVTCSDISHEGVGICKINNYPI